MVEQNKAVTNPGGKETCLHMGPWATSRLQSWCKRGVSSSTVNTTASLAFLLPLRLAHLTQPEERRLSPSRHRDATCQAASAWHHRRDGSWLCFCGQWNPWAVSRERQGRKEESRQHLNCELHYGKHFSSQTTWRCSQFSAYIGFSTYLFLFLKHSVLLYDEKEDRTAWILTDMWTHSHYKTGYNPSNCPPC